MRQPIQKLELTAKEISKYLTVEELSILAQKHKEDPLSRIYLDEMQGGN